MITAIHYSNAGVWRPDVDGTTAKKMAQSCEVSHMKLTCGAGSAAVAVYDALNAAEAIPANQKWFLDASQTVNDDNDFTSPLNFTRGVYVVLEQGAGQNAVFSLAVYR